VRVYGHGDVRTGVVCLWAEGLTAGKGSGDYHRRWIASVLVVIQIFMHRSKVAMTGIALTDRYSWIVHLLSQERFI
jgi:hypothetical protein